MTTENEREPDMIEPVAWVHTHKEQAPRGELSPAPLLPADMANGWTETPLYTASAIDEACKAERAGIVKAISP